MDDILFIILILTVVWYWWDTQQSNEIALAACKRQCKSSGLQLLDATIMRQRTWLRRGGSGSIQICRLYSFDYTNDVTPHIGEAEFRERESGYIVLIGKQVVETNIPHQDRVKNNEQG